MSSSRQRFEFLDGLRGIAALAVLGMHLGNFPSAGYLAVDFFFLLSGFVIAHAYGGAIISGTMKLSQFITRRVVRLYPLYAFSLLLSSLYLVIRYNGGDDFTLAEMIKTIFFGIFLIPYPGLGGDLSLFPANGPAWSLFYEFIFGFVMYPMIKYCSDRFIYILAVLLFVNLIFVGIEYGHLNFGWTTSHLYVGLSRAAFGFVCGVAIYKLRKHVSLPEMGILGALLIAAFLAGTMLSRGGAYANLLNPVVVGILFPFLIFLSGSVRSQSLIAAPLEWLGQISYPLYITHLPFIHILRHVLKEMNVPSGMITGLIIVAVLLVSSTVLDRIDRYIRGEIMRHPRVRAFAG